jgi:uncharacterized cupin superfamily protein
VRFPEVLSLAEPVIQFGSEHVELTECPIEPSWILEGTPVARRHVLSNSADGWSGTILWDCTAGRFHWHYGADESIYFLEGSVTIKDQAGIWRRLEPGDTVFFPAGSSAEWRVDRYIRKVAFCRVPVPRAVHLAKRAYRGLKRLVRMGNRAATPRSLFETV